MRAIRWGTSRSATRSQPAFTVQAGRGSSLTARLAAPPVVANGHVFTIDTLGAVRAFDARTGAMAGRARPPTIKGNEAALYGGGIAYDNGRIFATNGLGYRLGVERAERWDPVAGPPGRAAARRSDRRQRRGLCDQPGQPDLLAQGRGRLDQLVAGRLARDRGHLRRGRSRGRAGDGGRRLLVGRAQRLPLRERPPSLAGPARSAPASAPASRRSPTSTPIR